jgi:hypothetical protein
MGRLEVELIPRTDRTFTMRDEGLNLEFRTGSDGKPTGVAVVVPFYY